MADWASALAQGVGAAANTGAQIMGDQIRNDQQLQLEQQAANIKFDLAQRMAAADQMMKNAALNRYATVVKAKMGEEVPQEAQSVQQTGLTADSGKSLVEDGVQSAGFNGLTNQSGDQVKQLMAVAQQTLTNPRATDEQRADAKALLAQLTQQIGAQKDVNEEAVDGKTRKRTLEEATDAANADALQNDPEAYVAGTTAYNNANKDDMAQKRLDQQAKLATSAGERQLEIERMREQSRVDAILAKLGPDGAGAGGGKQQANVAQIEYLMNSMGLTKDQALAYVYGTGEAAHKSVDDRVSALASSLISNGQVRVSKDDPPGTNVASKALKMAREALLGGAGGAGGGMLDAAGGSVPNPLMPQGGAPTPANRPPLSSFRK